MTTTTPPDLPRSERDFCRYCGATIPPIFGEGTCPKCNPPNEGTMIPAEAAAIVFTADAPRLLLPLGGEMPLHALVAVGWYAALGNKELAAQVMGELDAAIDAAEAEEAGGQDAADVEDAQKALGEPGPNIPLADVLNRLDQ